VNTEPQTPNPERGIDHRGAKDTKGTSGRNFGRRQVSALELRTANGEQRTVNVKPRIPNTEPQTPNSKPRLPTPCLPQQKRVPQIHINIPIQETHFSQLGIDARMLRFQTKHDVRHRIHRTIDSFRGDLPDHKSVPAQQFSQPIARKRKIRGREFAFLAFQQTLNSRGTELPSTSHAAGSWIRAFIFYHSLGFSRGDHQST